MLNEATVKQFAEVVEWDMSRRSADILKIYCESPYTDGNVKSFLQGLWNAAPTYAVLKRKPKEQYGTLYYYEPAGQENEAGFLRFSEFVNSLRSGEQKNMYEIRYDTSKLGPEQTALIKMYAANVGKITKNSVEIALKPFSSEQGNTEGSALISVYRKNSVTREVAGECHVNVLVETNSDVKEYFLHVASILNMAIAVASIQEGKSNPMPIRSMDKETLLFLNTAATQYEEISGIQFKFPSQGAGMIDMKEFLKQMRNINLFLPRSARRTSDELRRYYESFNTSV
jgi:hypothetical protein